MQHVRVKGRRGRVQRIHIAPRIDVSLGTHPGPAVQHIGSTCRLRVRNKSHGVAPILEGDDQRLDDPLDTTIRLRGYRYFRVDADQNRIARLLRT